MYAGLVPRLLHTIKPVQAMRKWIFKCIVFGNQLRKFFVARVIHAVRIKPQVTAWIHSAVSGKIYLFNYFVTAT